MGCFVGACICYLIVCVDVIGWLLLVVAVGYYWLTGVCGLFWCLTF